MYNQQQANYERAWMQSEPAPHTEAFILYCFYNTLQIGLHFTSKFTELAM